MRTWQQVVSNLSSALLAVFLAVMVWVVAVYEKAPPRVDVLPEPIALQVLDLDSDLIISNSIPTEVNVRVRALADTWEQLRPEDFEATVDLLGKDAGRHDVPVIVTTLLPDVAVVDIQPAQLTVQLERMSERQLRVRVRVLDEDRVPLGYIARLPEVTPQQVTISGPESAVTSVAEAVIEVSVRDARDTVAKEDTPALLDSSGRRIRGLSVIPETVAVTIVVERQGGYRDVSVRATTSGSPAAGYWISNITVDPVLVTVWGEQSVIESLPGFVDTEQIDLSDATGNVIKRVSLNLPDGVLFLGDAAREGILVQISVEPLLGGITLQGTVEIRGLRPGLQARPSPAVVDVILSGPLPALQELKPEDVQVVLDLVNLGRGTHKVTPVVVLPEGLGLEVKSIVPDFVEVSID